MAKADRGYPLHYRSLKGVLIALIIQMAVLVKVASEPRRAVLVPDYQE